MMNKEQKKQVIFGRHPIVDAIASGASVDKIFLQQGTRGEFEKEIRSLSKENNIPCQFVPKEKLNKMVKGNHQGIVALLSLIPYYKVEDVLPTIYEKSEIPLFVILDGITDVRNLGAIARSAEVSGAHALIIQGKGSAMITSEGIKTSAGALTKIPVCREGSIISAIEYLQQCGVHIVASDLQASKRIDEIDFTVPIAIVLGSEGEGVRPAVLEKANETFIIPQKGTTDSFNVSVAGGIMLYETTRQRLLMK